MCQRLADELKVQFANITGITCQAQYMEKGVNHNPSLLNDGECGVYVFLNDNVCFKVGKAGPKSKARWNSHHYNLDNTTPSTLPKSIMRNSEKFKEYFPLEKHNEIEQLNSNNIGKWIRHNISRMEFKITCDIPEFTLNFLEAFLQFNLKPIFEGKKS